jgi:hypothetical protein
MPITDLDRVKRALRIPAGITVHDLRITEICGEVDGDLLEELDLSSWDSSTSYHETLDVLAGTAGTTTLVRRFPIASVVALTASGVRLVQDVDFRVDRGGVIRLLGPGMAFDPGRGNIEIQYTAGHIAAGATPTWLVRLGTLKAALQYNQEPQAGIGNLKVDPVQKVLSSRDEDALTQEMQGILARWLKPGD